MCGIAGIAGKEYLGIDSFCQQANIIQKHRGPDYQGFPRF